MPEISPNGMVVDPERPWLGGYFPEGDEGSLVPDVWNMAIDKYKITSVIDVGCGSGRELGWFRSRGLEVLGVDGLPPAGVLDIVEHDYTLGPYVPKREFDLCWCCEFVEHIAVEFIPNFIATFQKARYVMMTHGLYWQSGHHHVNCQRPEYWIERMNTAGFSLLARDTLISRDRALHHYWKHSGLIFKQR